MSFDRARGRGRSRGNWRGGYRGSWRGGWRGRGREFTERVSFSSSQPPSKRPRLVQAPLVTCCYKSWRTYFPTQSYTEQGYLTKLVKGFESYFQRCIDIQRKNEIQSTGSLRIDFQQLVKDDSLLGDIPNLVSDIRNQPENTLNAASLAMETVLGKILANDLAEDSDQSDTEDNAQGPPKDVCATEFPRLYLRLYNYQPMLPLKQLKAPQFGKLIAVRGTVVRVGNVKPLVTRLAFKCVVCEGIQTLILQDGKYTIPTKCLSDECRSRTFVPLRGSKMTETTDWQSVRLQEIAGDEFREAGKIPRTVECEMTGDLVDSCIPGDTVTIAAIVKATGSEEHRGRSNKDKCMFLLYLDAVSVCNSKFSDENSGKENEFSAKELHAIQEIHRDVDTFKLVVGSLCPTIYGQEIVKAGLMLGLFGGKTKHVDDKNGVPVRGDPHVLVVGDPGLGKSQMLQAAANVAPRGVYVCGNTSTTSGLTVTLTRDGSNGADYALEAGALVLGDRGCCCIDEFDKMGNQHQALLEAMEQQSISLAKAGIVCSLPARTSILAAANPTGGHYNKAKTVSENLKMGSALLSRFDLVFLLLDKPDEERDHMLSEHVMSMHSRKPMQVTAHRNDALQVSRDVSRILSNTSLEERLKLSPNEHFDPVPHQLLRKYISYARQFVQPKLSQEAAKVLQDFYLQLRSKRLGANTTPITTRQLESLIRLTEARARIDLREVASDQDAKDVIEIMKFSMYDTFSNGFGEIDFERSQNGSGMSSKSQAKRFVAQLNKIAETTFNSLFTVPHMKDIARKMGVQGVSLDNLIESLNNQGYLLKKGPKVYQLQTSSCI